MIFGPRAPLSAPRSLAGHNRRIWLNPEAPLAGQATPPRAQWHSAIGTKQTFQSCRWMSAFGGKAPEPILQQQNQTDRALERSKDLAEEEEDLLNMLD
jgi:hypothetical protein